MPGATGAKAGGASAAEAGKCVNDAQTVPNRPMNVNTAPWWPARTCPFRRGALLGGGELHADGDGRQAFQLGWMRVGLERCRPGFAVRDSRQRTRWRKAKPRSRSAWGVATAARGSKNAQELVALAPDAAEHPQLFVRSWPRRRPKRKGEAVRTPRATQPVWVRIFPISVRKS